MGSVPRSRPSVIDYSSLRGTVTYRNPNSELSEVLWTMLLDMALKMKGWPGKYRIPYSTIVSYRIPFTYAI